MSFERRKVRMGRVVADKMDKTVVVVVEWRRPHRLYKKAVRHRTRLKVHDEENQSRVGDLVKVVETRPLSKTKRWRVADIIEHQEIAEIRPEEITVDEEVLSADRTQRPAITPAQTETPTPRRRASTKTTTKKARSAKAAQAEAEQETVEEPPTEEVESELDVKPPPPEGITVDEEVLSADQTQHPAVTPAQTQTPTPRRRASTKTTTKKARSAKASQAEAEQETVEEPPTEEVESELDVKPPPEEAEPEAEEEEEGR